MEHRMGQNGTVAERAVGDEGVQVHQAAVYRCSVCTVWHTGMWACGRGMFVIVGILDTCVPQSGEWEMRCRCRQAKPRGGCNCKRAQPTVASDCVPTCLLGSVCYQGSWGVDSSSLSTVVGYGAVRCGAVLPGACS